MSMSLRVYSTVCSFLQKSKEDVRPSGTGARGGCQPPDMGAKNQVQVLQKSCGHVKLPRHQCSLCDGNIIKATNFPEWGSKMYKHSHTHFVNVLRTLFIFIDLYVCECGCAHITVQLWRSENNREAFLPSPISLRLEPERPAWQKHFNSETLRCP